ncbi:hypothetical protein ACOSQ3_002141 [Xanthoceras sorbifolium]
MEIVNSKSTSNASAPPSPPPPSAPPSPPPPSTPPQTRVPGIKNSTCFNCHDKGHWARDCPSKTPKKSQPTAAGAAVGSLQHPTVHCPCGAGPCVIRVSGTEKNPGRSFYTCPVPGTGQCKFFKWCDKVTDDDIKFCPQSTYPKCRCGAGICKKYKETSGPNAGRAYFVCPIKKGLGACPFIQWENTPVNTGFGEQVDERKGFGSPQSTCDRHQVFDFINSDVRKIDKSSLERSERKEFGVPELENPRDFSSFVTIPISSAEDDMRLTESRIYDQTSDMSSPNQYDSSPCMAPKNGSSILKSTIVDLVVSRGIFLMSQSDVRCRQREFLKQISTAEDISIGDVIYQSLGLHVLGWLGRLAFPPSRCLKDHPPKPFFCGIFPSFDSIIVPQDGVMLNLEGSTPLPHQPFNTELDNLLPSTPGADRQLWNGVPWKPSGLKRSFATTQRNILISSVSESLEQTTAPIQSLDWAAVQFEKTIEQAALHFWNAFVTILNTIDPSDHDTMMKAANKFFSELDHVQLPIDYEAFSRRVGEFIESASRLAGIEQSICKECSLEELTELYNGEKVRFDEISKFHDEAVSAFTNSSRRQQSLQEEASRVRDMLLRIENQLSCCTAETSELKTRVDLISEDMLESKKCTEEAEKTLKLRQQREEELRDAKAQLEQICWSMKRVCGLHVKKRQKF